MLCDVVFVLGMRGCGIVFEFSDICESLLILGVSTMCGPVKEYNCVSSRRANFLGYYA